MSKYWFSNMEFKIKAFISAFFAAALIGPSVAVPAVVENRQTGPGCKESEDADNDLNDIKDPYGAALSRSFASRAGMQGRFLAESQPADDLDKLMEESILGINHAEEASDNDNLFEGDILLPPNALGRTGLTNESTRWPDNTIVYKIAEDFEPNERRLIKLALKVVKSRTDGCIKYRKATEEDSAYVHIQNLGKGCVSHLGFRNNIQQMNLSSACFANGYGTTVHEFLHVLGIFHEQSRSDRDQWIKIEFDNIKPGKENNFKTVDASTTSEFGLEYDYKSIMHYSKYAFAKDRNKPVIISLLPDRGFEMGQRRELSQGDIKKIRIMYKCEEPIEW